MTLTTVRVFHVTKDHCHFCYVSDETKLASMLSNRSFNVETISVVCPEGYNEGNLVAFHQVEYWDMVENQYRYVNVATAKQVHQALNSLESRMEIDNSFSIYFHQVIV